jgi:hypothetical protein
MLVNRSRVRFVSGGMMARAGVLEAQKIYKADKQVAFLINHSVFIFAIFQTKYPLFARPSQTVISADAI